MLKSPLKAHHHGPELAFSIACDQQKLASRAVPLEVAEGCGQRGHLVILPWLVQVQNHNLILLIKCATETMKKKVLGILGNFLNIDLSAICC